MGRTTRTFKLSLSPAGLDLLIDAHCHLIRRTHCLIAWGMTLHVAVDHLDTLPSKALLKWMNEIDFPLLTGDIVHHVGAPHRLGAVAASIAERITATDPEAYQPTLGAVYILALLGLLDADDIALTAAFDRTQSLSRSPCIRSAQNS